MLTAHGIDPLKAYGGVPTITQMDVAGMMSSLKPCESALLRAKYCGEPASSAWAYWFKHLMDQGWESDGQIRVLSLITMDEFVREPRCKACGGTKGQMIDAQWVVCPRCDGLGYQAMSDRAIGRRMGMTRLREPWLGRLSWCRRTLQNWEVEAVKKLY